ncbi:hypothetical protein GCM10023258_14180 [Terrabacter aeriphilus]|uniref:VCBS repeat protein n=1 Tax=Terrabacter aeriphilus TaxID=515662 RepID=A0ABP9J7I7_9MICO
MSPRPRSTVVPGRIRRLALVPLAAIGLVLALLVAPVAQAAVLVGNDVSWPQCPASFPPTTSQFLVVGLTNGLPFTRNPCVATQVEWAADHAKPTQAYTMAGFPTSAQLTAYGSAGPWSATTRGGRLSNVGYAEGTYAAATIRSVSGWSPRMVWIDVEPRPAQPWPTGTALRRAENRDVVEGLMRGLRDAGRSYGLYSYNSGWQEIVGSWRLPGVPVWAASGRLDYPDEALDKCTQPSFSGGPVRLSQWVNDAGTLDYDRTCEPYAFTTLPVPAATLSNSTADFDGDWRNDVVARWAATGQLKLYSGTGTGSLALGRTIGTGWGGMSALETPGDLNGDGAADVLAREASTAYLWLYPGNGTGGWRLPRVRVGTAWNGMSAIVGVGDLSGDGRPDIVARRASDGTLFLYPGTGSSGWQPRSSIGTGWNRYSAILGAGDVDGNGTADLLARESATGYLWLVPGTGTGSLGTRVRVGTGWNGMTALVAAGDLDGNRTADLLARDASGRLWLYPRTETGGWAPRVLVSTGWNIVNALF